MQHEIGEGVGFGGLWRVCLSAEGDGEIDFLKVEPVIERKLELDGSLSEWFKMIYLFCEQKVSISAKFCGYFLIFGGVSFDHFWLFRVAG